MHLTQKTETEKFAFKLYFISLLKINIENFTLTESIIYYINDRKCY